MYDPLGLSIGTTNLVAAGNGNSPISRRAVVIVHPHCAPKVGLPEKVPGLTESGALMSGFVERIGSAVALISPDGSAHDPDFLTVEALDAMVVAAGADAGSSEIVIAFPSHWKPQVVQALRSGLRTHVGFVRNGMAPRLVPDAISALTAVNAELEIPDSGVVGLLDFGASGTSITLIETQTDFQPVSATIRYEGFAGNRIDQELLRRVIGRIGHDEDFDSVKTAAIGQLSGLGGQCRVAKERLSVDTVTELAVGLSGSSTSIQVTRTQLEDLMQERLTGFLHAFDDLLARNNISFADLAAVVAVGGGANIPLVIQRISLHTGMPVRVVSRPEYAAASGALLLASRGEELALQTRTSLAVAATTAGSGVIELPRSDMLVIEHDALTERELAWSQTEHPGDVSMRFDGDSYHEDGPCWSMRLNLIEPPKEPRWRRVRVSQLLIGLCAVVAMTAIGGVAFTLTTLERRQAPTQVPVVPVPSKPSVRSSLPPSPAPAPPTQESVASAEPIRTSVASPPPPVVVTVTKAPPVTTTTPPITTTTTSSSSSSTTSTTTEPVTTTTTISTVQMTTQWLHVPLLPVPIPVPIPVNQVPQNQSPQNPFLAPDLP